MRILVLESEGGTSEPVVDELMAAGHDVARCHDPAGPAFPCNGLKDHRDCPLDAGTISVAVLTGDHAPAHEHSESGEQGARCALRQYIPLVVVGHQKHSSVSSYATGFAAGPEAVVAAVEFAASSHLPRHEQVAVDAFRLALDTHGLTDVAARVQATLDDRGVRVVLLPSEKIPDKVAEVAGVRVAGAVRAIDPDAAMISVSVNVDDSPT